MPLPLGSWKMNLNGTETDFFINSVQDGDLRGTLLTMSAEGYWDESAQSITFKIEKEGGRAGEIAVFKGFLFRTPPNPQPGRDVIATLTGSVQVIRAAGQPVLEPISFLGPNFRRNVFGWLAQISEVQ